MKKIYRKINILAIIPIIFTISTLVVLKNINNIKIYLIIMIYIIIILNLNLLYKINKYNKLYEECEYSKKKYRIAMEALDGAIWEWSNERNKLFISKKIREILKINKDIDTFEEWFSFISNEEREDIRIFINNTIENKIIDNFLLEHTIIDSEGKELIIKFIGRGNVKENIFWLTGIIIDITEIKELENINNKEKEKKILTKEYSRDIVYWWNVKENIISIGNGIKKYINLSGNDDLLISVANWEKYIVKEDLEYYKYKMYKLIQSIKNEFYTVEYRILGKDNKIYWFECRGKKIIKRNGDIFIQGKISDITERKEKEIKINYLSFNDEITGLVNRRYVVREINKKIKKYPESKFALIFIDLDNFKYINDTYGHDVGDSLLREFSKAILEMKIEDSLLARYGGDEFIIFKNNIKDKQQIKGLLDDIIKNLSKPMVIDNKKIFLTISIGVSMYPIDGKELGILLKRSDMAMYLAKVNGKNRYEFFDIKILEVLNREFEIEKGLRVAIDNNEISLVFQPKININTREVVGFEALVRWISKELGNVPPNEFIPIAESSGIIIPLGKYIINESFKRCKELSLKTDKFFKMAINLSEVQIRDEKILDYISKTLKKYDLDAKYIEFEITESMIMKSAERNIKILEKLKGLGVTLALDDFGTGYSSLSYLRTLPIDVLKIDKSFIDGLLIEEKSEYIINSIIQLSHYLNLIVVAEGVESKEQFEYLKNSNCDIIQGYYFSKPIQFEEASKMFENL